jgi:hypothetical protein
MPEPIHNAYFSQRAAKAREMAGRAATPAARNIHLKLAADYLAADYDAKATERHGGMSGET